MFSVLLSLASSHRRFHRRHHRPLLNSATSDGYFMVDDINVSYTNCVNVDITRASEILTKASKLKDINEQLQTDLLIKAEDYFADPSTIKSKFSKWYQSNPSSKMVLKDPNRPLYGLASPKIMAAYYKYIYFIDGWYAEVIPGEKKLTIRAFTVKVSTDQEDQKDNLNDVIGDVFVSLNNPSTQEKKQIYNKIFQ